MPVISVDYCLVNAVLETEMVSLLVMVQQPKDAVASIMSMHKVPSECVNSAVGFYSDACGAAGMIRN
eukprot:9486558-Pyramimonas_sp.AAC.1